MGIHMSYSSGGCRLSDGGVILACLRILTACCFWRMLRGWRRLTFLRCFSTNCVMSDLIRSKSSLTLQLATTASSGGSMRSCSITLWNSKPFNLNCLPFTVRMVASLMYLGSGSTSKLMASKMLSHSASWGFLRLAMIASLVLHVVAGI
jgi:hypothetical protein